VFGFPLSDSDGVSVDDRHVEVGVLEGHNCGSWTTLVKDISLCHFQAEPC
jgi:hypothetical protein